MSIVKEFKEFAVKGNMIDMAVGIIIGGAFGKIVSSLVADIIMPPIGLLIGGINFTSRKFILSQAADGAVVTFNYGTFLQNIFDFLIVAMAIFMIVKAINSLKKEQAEAPLATPAQEILLKEIRDLLKEQKRS